MNRCCCGWPGLCAWLLVIMTHSLPAASPAAQSPGVRAVGVEKGEAVLEIDSGEYAFEAPLAPAPGRSQKGGARLRAEIAACGHSICGNEENGTCAWLTAVAAAGALP